MEDTWRQLEDQFWKTNGNCGRQLKGNWDSTSGRQVEDNQTTINNLRNLGGNWETTSGKPHIWETTGRQLGDKWKTTRQQVEKPWRELAGGPDTTSQTGNKGRQTSGEPDATSHTGRQINCYMRKQMNWRHRERLGDKWIAISGNKELGEPDTTSKWIARWGDLNELETSGGPDTTTWTEPDTS